MDGILLFASFVATIAGSILFYRRSNQGKLKPRVLTWYGWAIVNAVAAIAMYSDGHYPAALSASLLTLSGIVIGFWLARGKGTQFRQIDALVQVLVILAIVAWVFFNSPIIAVVASIVIDIVVALPVLRHYASNPAKQLLLPYLCWTIGAACAALASDAWAVTAVAFPFYSAALNLVTVAVIAFKKSKPTQHFTHIEEL